LAWPSLRLPLHFFLFIFIIVIPPRKPSIDTNTNTNTNMAPAPAPEPSYRKDEKVFCFHHELLYESKVLDVKPLEGDDRKSGFQYRVHYKGWKNT
jgi:hypothetical protein